MAQKPPDDNDSSQKEEFTFPALHEEEKKEASAPVEASHLDQPPPPPIKKPSSGLPQRSIFVRQKTAILVGGTFFIALGMWGVTVVRQGPGPDKEEIQSTRVDEIPVNVMEVRLGRFQDVVETVGTLKGEAEIELRFEGEGKIESFNFAEGARVKKGQIIAKLSDRDAKLKIRRAQNELEQMEKLYKLGGISKTKLDEARLNLDVAQSEMDKTRIVATRDGIIGDKSAELGEYVNPQRKIATLVAIKNVVVNVGIIEKQVDKVYPGQKILVTVDAYPGNIFEGKIETISPIADTGGSRTFEIRAVIPNEDSLMLPGMFARARIITYEVDDAISVPNDSLVKTPGGFQVFVVNKDNKAQARDVDAGYVATESTQIEGGLSPGELVVVHKTPELKSGSFVKIIEVQK